MAMEINRLPAFSVLRLYFLIPLCFVACNDQTQPVEPFEIEEVRTRTSNRYKEGDSIPYDDRWLVRALPLEVQSHEVAEQKGSNWTQSRVAFSQAEKTYLSDEYGYVMVRIGDYAADTNAFYHLLDTYKSLPDASQKFIRPEEKAFGWVQYEPRRQYFNLQAGINYRYGLDIKIFKKKISAEKVGKGQLWKIWEDIDFNQLIE